MGVLHTHRVRHREADDRIPLDGLRWNEQRAGVERTQLLVDATQLGGRCQHPECRCVSEPEAVRVWLGWMGRCRLPSASNQNAACGLTHQCCACCSCPLPPRPRRPGRWLALFHRQQPAAGHHRTPRSHLRRHLGRVAQECSRCPRHALQHFRSVCARHRGAGVSNVDRSQQRRGPKPEHKPAVRWALRHSGQQCRLWGGECALRPQRCSAQGVVVLHLLECQGERGGWRKSLRASGVARGSRHAWACTNCVPQLEQSPTTALGVMLSVHAVRQATDPAQSHVRAPHELDWGAAGALDCNQPDVSASG